MKSDTDTRCSRHTALLPYICEPRFCPLYTSCSGDLTFQSTNLPNDHSISQFRRNCYFFRLNFVFLFIFREYYYRLRILHPFGIDFVKMIFCGFLKLMIYLPNNLPILRAYKSLETIYSKAFGQFLIVSHLQ